jgi:hypothetical protein
MCPTLAAYFRRVVGSLGLSQSSGAYGACRLPSAQYIAGYLVGYCGGMENQSRQASSTRRPSLSRVHRSRVRWNKVRCVLLAFGHAFSSEKETMIGCPAIDIVALRP